MTADSFSHPEHEPVFLDEVLEVAGDDILELCGDNSECVFDAVQTGSTEIALDTLETDKTNTNDQMIAGKVMYACTLLMISTVHRRRNRLAGPLFSRTKATPFKCSSQSYS